LSSIPWWLFHPHGVLSLTVTHIHSYSTFPWYQFYSYIMLYPNIVPIQWLQCYLKFCTAPQPAGGPGPPGRFGGWAASQGGQGRSDPVGRLVENSLQFFDVFHELPIHTDSVI
jgi:hypothetical protein